MPGTTPTYGFPFQVLTDSPDGASLGEDLAQAIEDKIEDVDTEIGDRLPYAQFACVQVVATPVANTPTSMSVSWGKTLSGTVYAYATALTTVPGSVVEVSISGVSSTGCTLWVYRTTSSAFSVNLLAIAIP